MEAKYIEIAESTRAFRAPGLCLSSSLRPLLSRESSRLFLPFSRNLDEVARFSSCATLVNVTAAATLGEPQCPPQKSSLPRAHNGPRSSRGDRFLDSRQWGPVHPNFSLSLLSLSLFLLLSSLSSPVSCFPTILRGFRLRAKFRSRANGRATLSSKPSWKEKLAILALFQIHETGPRSMVSPWLLRQIG